MRRHVLSVLGVLAIAVPASAQQVRPAIIVAPDPTPISPFFTSASDTRTTGVKLDAVVARVMSFDANHDGVVVKTELPERLQTLLTRGDASADGALDANEVRRLATKPVMQQVIGGFQLGHYAIGEDVGLSSRSHVEGAIQDLALAKPLRDQVMTSAMRFLDSVDAITASELLARMAALLTPSQLADFKSAVERQNGPVRTVSMPDGSQTTVVTRVDLSRYITRYRLSPELHVKANAAIGTFTAQSKLEPAARVELVAVLSPLLNAEQRDDLRAALERRPVVKGVAVIDSSTLLTAGQLID